MAPYQFRILVVAIIFSPTVDNVDNTIILKGGYRKTEAYHQNVNCLYKKTMYIIIFLIEQSERDSTLEEQ